MMTWDEANRLFTSARNKAKGKPIERNTRVILQRSDDNGVPVYGIEYHETTIIEIYIDGKYIYDTGGWQTISTKKRMNEYGPITIYQREGIWYARNGATHIPYVNGMTTYV